MQHLTPQYQHFLPKVHPVTASSTNPTRQRSLSGGSARPSRRDQPAARPGSANSIRSNNSAYSRPGSKSCESSTDSLTGQRKSLQYHSNFSCSSKKGEKVGLAPMFQRSLTPRWKSFLDRNYFIKNPLSDKFSDVRKSGRCLRCYDNQHQAINCKLYRLLCPEPCRLCHFLFHKADECKNFSLDGKPKP